MFLSVFRNEIGGVGDDRNVTRDEDEDGPPFDPASKGKKKGHNKSPTDPE
jgi:hypothetical protein